MGFAKYFEDNVRLNDERTYRRKGKGGERARRYWEQRAAEDAYRRPRELIRSFEQFYQQEVRLTERAEDQWTAHFDAVRELVALLSPMRQLQVDEVGAADAVAEVRDSLDKYFRLHNFGPLSQSVFESVRGASESIVAKGRRVDGELSELRRASGTDLTPEEAAAIEDARQRLAAIDRRLSADLAVIREHADAVEDAAVLYERFVALHAALAARHRRRPPLQKLDRFSLNAEQEKFVTLDQDGWYRLQGAAGSGKTIIVIHRALRLAQENPRANVQLFTINRELAKLIDAAISAVNPDRPANLHVHAFHDLLAAVLGHFGAAGQYRLRDDRSAERAHTDSSWRDFYRHQGRTAEHNIFAEDAVRKLRKSVSKNGRCDPERYLREEMVYIQTARTKTRRDDYLSAPRRSRSIRLSRAQRKLCLEILDRWEEWLATGHLSDLDGLTLKAAEYFGHLHDLKIVRRLFPTDHVLVDEAQDFSTLELRLIRLLTPDRNGINRFFFAGDHSQKVYPKHHDTPRARFNFTNRAGVLRRNHRNTRQILAAAANLPRAFPPQDDSGPGEGVMDPERSDYDGDRPVLLRFPPEEHAKRVYELVRLFSEDRMCRIAVVGDNEDLLTKLHDRAVQDGRETFLLERTEDVDRWRDQGSPLTARLVFSSLEAVKGFEFDCVIACDLSEHVVPARGTLSKELWRKASILYTALTRARDKLVMTYCEKRSPFMEPMVDDIDEHRVGSGASLRQALGFGHAPELEWATPVAAVR